MSTAFQVPFVFGRFGRLPGRSGIVRMPLLDYVSVPIPEIAEEDAPLAARAKWRGRRPIIDGFGGLAWREATLAADYRLIGRRLAKLAIMDPEMLSGCPIPLRDPAPGRDWAARSGLVCPATAQHALDAIAFSMVFGGRPLPHALPGRTRGSPPAVEPFDGVRMPEVRAESDDGLAERIADDRDAAAARVRHAMEAAAFVGGLLYLPTLGPCWLLERDGEGVARGVRVSPEAGWVADHRDAFQANDADARAAYWGLPAPDRAVGSIRVLIPGAFPHPDEYAARQAAASLFEAGAARLLGRAISARGLAALARAAAMLASDKPCAGPMAGILGVIAEETAKACPGGVPRRDAAAFHAAMHAGDPLARRAALRAGATHDRPTGPRGVEPEAPAPGR